MKHEIKVPAVGESITEVTVAQWLKSEGDYVEAEELICEIESDKASFEIPAEVSGVLSYGAAEGDVLDIGSTLALIEPSENGQATSIKDSTVAGDVEAAQSATVETTEESAGDSEHHARISPVAANILAEAGISPDSVNGSGPGGKVTKEDAIRARDGQSTTAESDDALSQPAAAPATAGERGERSERMSGLRKTIAARLVAAKNETAMLTTFNEIDMSAVKAVRAAYKEKFQDRYDVKLGFMSFFTKAVCIALQEWPAVNGKINDNHIIYHDYCDISIAVSTPRGLVVPVIRNAQQLSLAGIESAVLDLAKKARDNKLTIEEMTGGTFTITNGGVFGSLVSTPIINAPQSAILGLHKIEDRPVVVNGEVTVRPMMYVALSYDHRIIDGRESVSFLVRIKELIEDPTRMLLEI